MSDQRMVCRHCGSDSFYAEVTCTGWMDSSGVFVGENGKPHFEPDGHIQDTSSHEYSIESYVCNGCERSHWDLAKLVTRAPTPASTCECGHQQFEHPEKGFDPKLHQRGLMPCTVSSCSCEDFVAVGVASVHPHQAQLQIG